jgi:tRNA dimethylallyltransferase
LLPPLVVIAGATATGKTALSLELAARLGRLEVVSADSRQVYRGMDVGTAKATAEERARVPHHCLDVVDPDEAFTAADFRAHALAALTAVARRRHAALLVGGTGLYLRVVARGVALGDVPPDPLVRAELAERLENDGLTSLVDELRRIAPTVAAGVDSANPRRVVRALERARRVGDRPPPPPMGYAGRTLWLGLSLPDDVHRRRIAARAEGQFSGGLLDEARALARTYGRGLPAFSAFGYREALAHLAGELSLEQAVERTITRTTAYARRQRTWFRAETDVTWVDSDERAADRVGPLVREFLRR